MKINETQLQQSTQGIQDTKKIGDGEEQIDFQGLMVQIMNMMNVDVKIEGQQMNEMGEEEVLSQLIQQIEGEPLRDQLSMQLLDTLSKEDLTALPPIKEEGIGFKQEGLQKLAGESLEKIVQRLRAPSNEALSISSERIDTTALQKLLKEVAAIGNSILQEEGDPNLDQDRKEFSKELLSIDFKRSNRFISILTPQQTQETQQEGKQVLPKESIEVGNSKITDNTLMEKVETKKLDTTEQPSVAHQSVSFSRNLENIQKPQQQTEVQNMPEIVKEMVEEIKVLKEGEQSSLQVKIKPKELGEIQIKLEMKAGEVVVKVLVESMSAKGALDHQLQGLKEQLKSQNIILQEVDVHLQQNSQEGQGQGRRQTPYSQDDSSPNPRLGKVLEEEGIFVEQAYIQQPYSNSYYNRGSSSSLNLLA